jgi:hypothetical protein
MRFCLKDLSRRGLAQLLNLVHPGTVRAAEVDAEETVSGSATGTLADLVAQYSLIVE